MELELHRGKGWSLSHFILLHCGIYHNNKKLNICHFSQKKTYSIFMGSEKEDLQAISINFHIKGATSREQLIHIKKVSKFIFLHKTYVNQESKHHRAPRSVNTVKLDPASPRLLGHRPQCVLCSLLLLPRCSHLRWALWKYIRRG